jgi:hypothetical protein
LLTYWSFGHVGAPTARPTRADFDTEIRNGVSSAAANLNWPMHVFLNLCAVSEGTDMVQAFEDATPSNPEVTNYDVENTMLYLGLLDRKERGMDWHETVLAYFDIDSEHELERARRVYDRHLARATSLVNVPYFSAIRRLAPYLRTNRQEMPNPVASARARADSSGVDRQPTSQFTTIQY